MNPPVTITNTSKGAVLATSGELAAGFFARLKGLLGRDGLGSDGGLLIPGCSSIHMFFMRFPIDVLFLDADHKVVSLREGLKPWAVAWGGWRARDVVELPAGTIAATGTEEGHVVAWSHE